MGGVYGSFMENFPELYETFTVWYEDDKSDAFTVRAIYMPNKGNGIKRRKYTSGNTGLDITESDNFYISRKYDNQVKIGAYLEKVSDNIIMRLTKLVPYDKAAGYRVYVVERVTGTTVDDTEDLPVKEGTFA